MSVQKLRLKQGWSQQQLADASGLSVRTIQRIEAGHPASTETLKSLAAVFEVDFNTLDPERNMHTLTHDPQAREEQEAFDHVRRLRGFYAHVAAFVLANLLMVAINLLHSPDKLWFFWPLGGWAIGLLAHGWKVHRPKGFLGPDWERAQVEKHLGRPL